MDPLQLIILTFSKKLPWNGGGGGGGLEADRWSSYWLMLLMLSWDSFRILMSTSEERLLIIISKGRIFKVVTHAGQLHGKLTVKEASLVYSAGVTLQHLMWHQERQRSH